MGLFQDEKPADPDMWDECMNAIRAVMAKQTHQSDKASEVRQAIAVGQTATIPYLRKMSAHEISGKPSVPTGTDDRTSR